jgi:hypothetical protein
MLNDIQKNQVLAAHIGQRKPLRVSGGELPLPIRQFGRR